MSATKCYAIKVRATVIIDTNYIIIWKKSVEIHVWRCDVSDGGKEDRKCLHSCVSSAMLMCGEDKRELKTVLKQI